MDTDENNIKFIFFIFVTRGDHSYLMDGILQSLIFRLLILYGKAADISRIITEVIDLLSKYQIFDSTINIDAISENRAELLCM